MRRILPLIALLLSFGLAAAACGDDDDSAAGDGAAETTTGPGETTTAPVETTTTAVETTTTTAPVEPLRILVTNDDGVGAAGIDALVEALRALPDTEVTVIAPATNQSGSGDQTTAGDLVVGDATTASGYESTAVTGFPADSIVYALDQGGLSERPHVVISGINEGQNIGPFTALSGTVGAARAAARRGVPALASSQGLLINADGSRSADYASGVVAVLEWLAANRDELLARDVDSVEPAEVANLDIPTCTVGAVRGTIEVPIATEVGDRNALAADCESTATDPVDDIDAFNVGYAPLTEMNVADLDALIAALPS